jgi:Flp pilus assembly protein TadB
MQSSNDPGPSGREVVLTILLLTLVAAGVFLFMVAIMGMFVIHALIVFTLISGFGLFHYLLWGRAMSQDVAAEREQQALADGEDWPEDGPHRPPRFPDDRITR